MSSFRQTATLAVCRENATTRNEDLSNQLLVCVSILHKAFDKMSLSLYKAMNMKQKATDADNRQADKVEIAIHLDSELVEQIQHLTNDPSKVIEVAIRQWLRGEVPRDDELTRTPYRTPVPPRGEWND